MDAIQRLMVAGANAVKLEACTDNLELIEHIVASGVPVMGHLGLTPQAFHQLGGFRVQGKQAQAANKIIEQAIQLEKAGCFSLVLECVPSELSGIISKKLSIPTIGIGAGPDTDGQVLVLYDLLGMQDEFKPKFLKTYCNAKNIFQQAISEYDNDVKKGVFPSKEHSYI